MKVLSKEQNKEMKYSILLAITVGITNISQMPYLIENSFTRLVSLPFWLIMFIVCLFNGLITFSNKVLFPIMCSFIFTIGILFLTLFTEYNYINTSMFYSYCLSIFVFFIGFWVSKKVDRQGFRYVISAYILTAVIVAVNIYFKCFRNSFSIMSNIYAYGAKNSISQIVFTALVFLSVVYTPKIKAMVLVKWIGVVFLTMLILSLKSRATILGIAIMFIIIIFFSRLKTNMKIAVILIIAIVAILLLNSTSFYNVFVNAILFVGRDPSNLNELSSGRMAQILSFPVLIKGNELFGVGDYYIESFPLDAWIQYGYLFGSILIIISIWPIIWGFRNLSKDDAINIAFIIIACSYWVNGLFEQLAPFGPGVKCFMLWLMFGFLIGNDKVILNRN